MKPFTPTETNNKRVSALGEIGIDCREKPYVRPPWCRQRVRTFNDEPSMTQQSHVDQTDVNAIVKRFERTGVMPEGRGIPQYGDVTGLQGDLTELLNRSKEQIGEATEFARNWKEPEPAPIPTPSPPEPTPVPSAP